MGAAYTLGVHIRPQHTTVAAMRQAWRAAIERTTNLPATAIEHIPE